MVRSRFKRRLTGATWTVLAGMLLGAWYFNIFVFTILFVVVFSGIICINYHNVRDYIPGLVTTRPYLRILAIGFYLITSFALIGEAFIASLK
jgi:hypothetical protein